MGTAPAEKIYSAPRRFDLATIFAVTFAYSLLFAVMSSLGSHPVMSLIVGGFVTLVGIGQALLYGGNNARVASVLTGAVINVPLTMALTIWGTRSASLLGVLLMAPVGFALGGACGYLAGTLVGGVFLVADKLRQLFANRALDAGGEVLEPIDDAVN
jgi:hypothetical protein